MEGASDRVRWLKLRVRKLWILSPEKLWLASIALHGRGRWVLAFWLKQLNGFLYHNSLAPGASVSPDIFLGHNSLGVMVSRNVEIGRGVVIWPHVMLLADRPETHKRSEVDPAGEAEAPASSDARPVSRIIIEDGVRIGAKAAVIAPRAKTLRVGRGAFIGAGTVVTKDVPARATIVGAAPRLLADEADIAGPDAHEGVQEPAPEAPEPRA
jgi:serine O-acetyltransferase